MASPHRLRWRFGLLPAVLLALGAVVARGAVTCQESAGPPGQQTTVRLDILDPATPSAVIPPTSPCGQDVLITGTVAVAGPSADFDVYLVVDGSSSTDGDSDADVDGDTLLGGPGDTIYMAEIAAAREFVSALDPAHVRVAVIRFNSTASLEHPLSADLASVDATLAAMRVRVPFSTTSYVPAMQAVEDEVAASGDPARRQQRSVFLSDGRQDETIAEIDAAAAEVAALGVVMDTFALGFSASQALQHMASITGGTFTHLVTPGEIVAILPSFVPDPTPILAARNEQSPVAPLVMLDPAARTFSVRVKLEPGDNHVVLTLSTQGVNPVSVDCALDLLLPLGIVADAGPALAACEGTRVILNGGASVTTGCALPVYHWLDCNGADACPPSASAVCEVPACSACDTYTLEVSCLGQPCTASGTAQVTCFSAPLLAPAALTSCGIIADLTCGGDPRLNDWWDLDAHFDQDRDGDPGNDRDLVGCDVTAYFFDYGVHDLVALARNASGCTAAVDLSVALVEPPLPAEFRGRACPLASAALSCGVPDPASTYWWDLETEIDADGDGDPGNDPDVQGCDASGSWGVEGFHEVAGWQRDAGGCVNLIAHGQVEVSDDRMPFLEPRQGISCHLSLDVSCGGDPSFENSWDLDAASDADGDGDARNDEDVAGCDVTLDLPDYGFHELVALSRDGAGCQTAAGLVVELAPPPAPRDIEGGLCLGAVIELSCGAVEPMASYWWDLDGTLDWDGDGDPANDADSPGCDVTPSWGVAGLHDVACWRRDATGCVELIAQGVLEVSAFAAPGETPDLRLFPEGAAGVRFEWGAVPGAVDYRMSRGTIASLHDLRRYDHAADDVPGAGACTTNGARVLIDGDDRADDVGYYYLATAVNDCAGEGPTGHAEIGRLRPDRPPRIPTASCP